MAEKLYAKKEALEKPALGGSAANVLLFLLPVVQVRKGTYE